MPRFTPNVLRTDREALEREGEDCHQRFLFVKFQLRCIQLLQQPLDLIREEGDDAWKDCDQENEGDHQ